MECDWCGVIGCLIPVVDECSIQKNILSYIEVVVRTEVPQAILNAINSKGIT